MCNRFVSIRRYSNLCVLFVWTECIQTVCIQYILIYLLYVYAQFNIKFHQKIARYCFHRQIKMAILWLMGNSNSNGCFLFFVVVVCTQWRNSLWWNMLFCHRMSRFCMNQKYHQILLNNRRKRLPYVHYCKDKRLLTMEQYCRKEKLNKMKAKHMSKV